LVPAPPALGLLVADLALALGTRDSHVEMVIVGAGAGWLLEQRGGLADVALEAGVLARVIEQTAAQWRGYEHVAQAGPRVVYPRLDQQPVAVVVEAQAAAVFGLAIAVEGHHAWGVDGLALGVEHV